MKSVLVIETPKDCGDCQFHRIYADGHLTETFCILTARSNANGVNTRAKWCPLRHPLKEVDSDFYIYDRKFLFDHLEKEFAILKDIKAFEEFIKAREEEGNKGKKPLPKDESHEYYGCPSCRHIVSSVQNYCENCGQKLDWRDIGETE